MSLLKPIIEGEPHLRWPGPAARSYVRSRTGAEDDRPEMSLPGSRVYPYYPTGRSSTSSFAPRHAGPGRAFADRDELMATAGVRCMRAGGGILQALGETTSLPAAGRRI